MKPYFVTCKEAMEARLLLQVRPLGWGVGVRALGGRAGEKQPERRARHAHVFFRRLDVFCVSRLSWRVFHTPTRGTLGL